MDKKPEDEEPDDKQDSVDNNLPLSQGVGDTDNPPKETAKSVCEHHETKSEKYYFKKEIINGSDKEDKEAIAIAKEANKLSKSANRISKWAIGINALVILIAVVAIWQTQNALTISSRALSESLHNDSIADLRFAQAQIDAQDQIRLNQIRDSNTLAVAAKSLDAQIASIKEVEKQFTIDNKPYLKIHSVNYDYDSLDNTLGVNYQIDNIGKYPVRVLSEKWDIIIDTLPPNFYRIYRNKKLIPEHDADYIVTGFPHRSRVSVNFSKKEITSFQKYNLHYIFFYGYIIYQNLITKEKSQYRYHVKIEPRNTGFHLLKSENVHLP